MQTGEVVQFTTKAKKLIDGQPVTAKAYLNLCREAIRLAKTYPQSRGDLAVELVSVGAYLKEDNLMIYKYARTIADEAADLEWDLPNDTVDPHTGLTAAQKWSQFQDMVESAIGKDA